MANQFTRIVQEYYNNYYYSVTALHEQQSVFPNSVLNVFQTTIECFHKPFSQYSTFIHVSLQFTN